MKKLDDYEIAQSYIGKTVNIEKLNQCFQYIDTGKSDFIQIEEKRGYKEYHAFCNDYYEEEEWEIFKLTDALYEHWEESGIDFKVIIHVKNEKVITCKIYKHKDDLGGCWGRCISEDLIPSQQEIRIFRRIMDYITL